MSIQCSAISCAHNKDSICYANAIIVEGRGAHTCSETACATYTEPVNEGFNEFVSSINAGDSPCSRIACKAESCAYNDHEKCMAMSINVSGIHAHTYTQTDCETYRQR